VLLAISSYPRSSDHRILYCVPAAVRGPDPTSRTPNRGDVCGFSAACRLERLMLGDRLGVGASLVHETRASQVTRACVRAHIDWRWDVAVAGTATGLRGSLMQCCTQDEFLHKRYATPISTRPRLSSPMPAVAHHGGDTALWKVCLPASDIGRSPGEPRIIAQDRTVESHAGIS
jgi:hypothetical protein